jgi:ATP-dependent RNA helicase DDX24/MAK5
MVGLKKSEAGSDMIMAKKKKQKQSVVSKKDFEEEWDGITSTTDM